MLETTIFLNPLDIDLILRTVERSQNKEELYKEFIKDPEKVMSDALNSLQKPDFAFDTLQKIDLNKDIRKSDSNQILCYKPMPSHLNQKNNHSCTIVCKNREEYRSLYALIEQAKEKAKHFIFNKDDILLLIGEKHDSKLDNKTLLNILKNKYPKHHWEMVGEHFSAPLEFDEFINIALEAYKNNPVFLAGEKVPIQIGNDGEPLDNKPIDDFYNNELAKNAGIVGNISKQNWGFAYSKLKFTMQDIYQACFVKNREILRQLQFFLSTSSRHTSVGGRYVETVVNAAKQSMTPEEEMTLDALKIGSYFIGSDPNVFSMVAKKVFPDKDFYPPTDKNLSLHKDDGYFCIILPNLEASYIITMFFYTPTVQETDILLHNLLTEVIKVSFKFDNKMENILKAGEQNIKYDIVEEGKVKISWNGTRDSREQIANLLHTKWLSYYGSFLERFKLLQHVESDKLSLIYKKYNQQILDQQQNIRTYLDLGNYHNSKEDTYQFTFDEDLEKFFGHVELLTTLAEEAQAEMEPLLKQHQLFNFSHRDISLIFGPAYAENEINEKQLIDALDKRKIKYNFIEKTANGWAIQFDRSDFIQFTKFAYLNLLKEVKKCPESINLDKEIQGIMKEYLLGQKDIEKNAIFFQAAWLEEDERSGQIWRLSLYHLIFVQYAQYSLKMSKSIPVIITRDNEVSELENTPEIPIPSNDSLVISSNVDSTQDKSALNKPVNIFSIWPATNTAQEAKLSQKKIDFIELLNIKSAEIFFTDKNQAFCTAYAELISQIEESDKATTLEDIMQKDSLFLKTKINHDGKSSSIESILSSDKSVFDLEHIRRTIEEEQAQIFESHKNIENKKWYRQCLSVHAGLIKMRQDYADLGRIIHQHDIDVLITSVSNIILNSKKTMAARYKEIMNTVKQAYDNVKVGYYLFSMFSDNNSYNNSYYYPRMLKEIIESQSKQNLPSPKMNKPGK